ncbi:protoporphyrinogen IX oxidase, aerobic, HemY [Aquipluma nitroreducens]|uniref:Coproporphyrinogen III oxidase n=1 Tax=Aquipluma nitroreducens TaxID=2010828 RepID=A0A5K7SDQ4_9BACT|nr:protoporphyrinogen oxidase [Aquipluma nitroreducens]BBE19731.1 protoporphyrinogen IX oxidase, aerobic, HemY [Aquipluma nitroreducens]
MAESLKPEVVIIGAGLTGLTMALYLKKAGIDFKIIEKSAKTGGVIQTISEKGFVYETGPNTGVVSCPEMTELFEELAGKCELEIADPSAKRRLIWKNQAWHALPSGLISAVGTPLFTWYDKFRILGEPFRKKGNNPNETLANLVKRRMGQSYLDYAIDPFISGIYAGDPTKLVTKYAMPKLYNLEQEYGSFIKGAMKKAKLPKTDRDKKATKEVFSAKGGLGRLIEALTVAVGTENILLSAETMVKPIANGFQLQVTTPEHLFTLETSHLVTTCGGYALTGFLPFLNENEVAPFNNLKYAEVTQVLLGFKKWKGMSLNAFGGLVPGKENKNILGVLFTSSFFKGRAPEGGALLSVFMGGTKRPDIAKMDNDEIEALLNKDLPRMMSNRSLSPDMIRIHRYPKAIPQYTESSKERFEMIEQLQQKYPGLILAGNIRDGIGMADRVKQGRSIAEELISKIH